MLFSKAIKRKSIREGAKVFFAVLLLALYVIGNARIEVFHQLIHNHRHTLAHSVAQEKDPCHRAIYHHETPDGCKHKFHLTTPESCSLCHTIPHADQLFISVAATKFDRPETYFSDNLSFFRFTAISILLPARAPPTF